MEAINVRIYCGVKGGAADAFFEGVVLKGASTDAADAAVQADINSIYSRATIL